MTTTNDMRSGLLALAKRSVSIMGACSNAESTKLYLALPFLGLLGYDYTNPYEVYPDHVAGLPPNGPHRADFAILKDGEPIIALECRASGCGLANETKQIAAYFHAAPKVKLAILTNGVLFQVYVDSDHPDHMDTEAFLTLDLEMISRAGVSDEIVEGLVRLAKDHYDPANVAETAHVQLVRRRLQTVLLAEAASPSDDFCRFVLEKIGLKGVRKEAIDRYYGPLIKTTFDESLVLPIVHRLQAGNSAEAGGIPLTLQHMTQHISTSERELALLGYVRRRLAYLVDNEEHFNAIENVRAKDYVGRVAIYFGREEKGRLFDFIAGADQADKYIFPEPIGEMVTNTIGEIDAALKITFAAKVRELSPAVSEPNSLVRRA